MNIIEKIKAFWAVKDFVEGIQKEARMDTASSKPGWKTTEFWLTVAAQAATLWGAVKGFVPANYATIISIVGASVYTIARTISKAVSDVQATKVAVAATTPIAVVTPAA